MSLLVQHIIQNKKDNIIIVDENRKISRQELSNEINQLKEKILDITAQQNCTILLSGNNNADFLLLLLAMLDLSLKVVLLDPKSSISEMDDLIDKTRASFIFYESNLFNNKYSNCTELKTQNTTYYIHKISDKTSNINVNIKLYLCSSGSTGQQKIFGFNDLKLYQKFSNLANYLQFTEVDQSLCSLTITHSHGLMICIPILLNGGCVHFLNAKNCQPEQIIQYVHAHKISVLTGVPYQYNLMLHTDIPIKNPLQTLRYCFCGSAPMSYYLTTTFFKKFKVRLNQAYGVSEIGPICINIDNNNNNVTSVGKVFPYIEYKILKEDGSETIENEEGELIVRSSFMSNEYLNNPEETKSTFINNWIFTKDIVKKDCYDNIYVVGRKSNFINVAGYKIYPIEIEKVILSMPVIKEAVVFGIHNELKGQTIKAVVSTLSQINEDEIKLFCQQHLPSYKIPHDIQIENSLKQTSIHKVELSAYKN